jgi:hypothetical protein
MHSNERKEERKGRKDIERRGEERKKKRERLTFVHNDSVPMYTCQWTERGLESFINKNRT